MEIVFEVLSLALGVVEGYVVAERTVEVDWVCFLLEDGQHDVGCGGGPRGRRRGHDRGG